MPKPAMARLSMNSVQLLGGSGVVISRVVSPLIWVISIVTLLITLPITTHEPPSEGSTGAFRFSIRLWCL